MLGPSFYYTWQGPLPPAGLIYPPSHLLRPTSSFFHLSSSLFSTSSLFPPASSTLTPLFCLSALSVYRTEKGHSHKVVTYVCTVERTFPFTSNQQVEFEDYEFDQKISRNYLIMQAAAQREIEGSVGNFERSGSETPEPENQQLNCKFKIPSA